MPVSAPGVVLTVVAVVAGGGAGGPLRIDRGLLDGLRPGDRGSIQYVLMVGSEERPIPAGEAVVTRVAADEAWIETEADRPVRPGYRVRFELAPNRLAPAELLRAARENLEDPERQAVERRIVAERLLGGDEEVVGLLREQLEAQAEAAVPASPPRSLDSARDDLSAGDESTARDDLRAAPSRGADEGAAGSAASPFPGMFLVPAGTYPIGATAGEAAFYNEQPRFESFLEAFWIDTAPLRLGAVGEGRPAAEGGASDGTAAGGAAGDAGDGAGPGGSWLTAVTFGEAAAFCRRLGRRLPTEIEWEAAVRAARSSTAAELETPILEWTASWYRPYPGNPVSESEYGERYRVLRGARPGESPSPTRRRFMAPDARHPAVGFRCVADG